MHPRAQELIELLQLQPHPEGGHFVETFRSPLIVTPIDSRGSRTALTVIYFLLTEGEVSRWHRVQSDEAWHWHEGHPLDLFVASPDTNVIQSFSLGPASQKTTPQHIVPAGHWQAARSAGAYTLVGCSVGPGFEFSDFTMLSSLPGHGRPPLTPPNLFVEFL